MPVVLRRFMGLFAGSIRPLLVQRPQLVDFYSQSSAENHVLSIYLPPRPL